MKKILSTSEISYTREGIKLGIRNDGRANNDIREIWLEIGNLKQANGSSKIYITDSNTSILIGIKLEIGSPILERPNEGIINITVDSIQRSLVENKDKNEINEIHVELTNLLEEFMIEPIDKKKFCLVPGKKCWILHIDVFCLELLNPIYIDQISLGVKAALLNLEIPALNVLHNKITDEYEIDIIEDKLLTIIDFLDPNTIPILISIGEVDKFLIVDLTEEEDQVCNTKTIVSVDLKGNIYGIRRLGQDGLFFEEMAKLFTLAKITGINLLTNLNKLLKIRD